MCSAYTVLAQRPESFDGISVNISQNENLFSLRHDSVLITHCRQRIIGVEFVGVYFCFLFNVCIYNRHDGFGLSIVNRLSNQISAALNHPKNRSLGFRASALIVSRALARVFVLFFAAVIQLIHLDVATQKVMSFTQHLANKIAHAPSRLIGYARFPLN